ncbi:MAG: hypothetical protein Q9165_001201 [Trypethelium subeluteriae]
MLQVAVVALFMSVFSLTTAKPLLHRRQAPLDPGTTPFYLVTTSSSTASSNSSTLSSVSATSFYDAEYATDYTIRQQPPGYNYIPTFTLVDGNLQSLTYTPHANELALYNSTATAANATLSFAPATQPQGCLSLKNGYLLAKDGETKGWTICPYGEDEEPTKELNRILSTQTPAPAPSPNITSNTTSQTSYLFTCPSSESDRLDVQHTFVRTWCRGALLHPSIPRHSIQRVADIGCGTGIWMRDMKESTLLDAEFVGFDIDDAQFPGEARCGEEKKTDEGIRHVVHDVTKRFPREHREADGEGFDLVHVRFMSLALKELDVEKVVRNLYEILKPGGYLQWQDLDLHNLLFFPETRTVTALTRWLLRERLELGLASAVTPLLLRILATLKLAQGSKTTNADKLTLQNASSHDEYAFNVLQVQTIPTWDHPDLEFRGQVQAWMNDAGTAALLAMVAKRKKIMKFEENSRKTEDQLCADIRELEGLVNMYKEGGELQRVEKHALLNWTVARKVVMIRRDESWMHKTRPRDEFRVRNML